eukprot:8892920-Alexandrium_andersonii.AAC.1
MSSGVDTSSKVPSVEYFAGDMAYAKAARSSANSVPQPSFKTCPRARDTRQNTGHGFSQVAPR